MNTERKLRIQRHLNKIALQFGGDRLMWIFRPAIGVLWRRLDRAGASTDTHFLVDYAPPVIWGGVGGDSYTGWVYQQGFLAALIRAHTRRPSLKVLDFGCGYGKLAPIGVPLTYPEGEYLGVDIRGACIDFCRAHYRGLPRTRFVLSSDTNATYSDPSFATTPAGVPLAAVTAGPARSGLGSGWPVEKESMDVVVAISVFTHLREEEAGRYIRALHSILKPGGIGILTFLLMESGFADRPRYQTALPPSYNFFTRAPERPEDAIAVNAAGLDAMLAGHFEVLDIIRSSFVDSCPIMPQDVVVLKRRDYPCGVVQDLG